MEWLDFTRAHSALPQDFSRQADSSDVTTQALPQEYDSTEEDQVREVYAPRAAVGTCGELQRSVGVT